MGVAGAVAVNDVAGLRVRDERVLVEEQYERMCKAVELWIADGTEKAVSTMGR